MLRHTVILLGLAIILFGACDSTGTGDNTNGTGSDTNQFVGTWYYADFGQTLDMGEDMTFTSTMDGEVVGEGTYEYDDTTITMSHDNGSIESFSYEFEDNYDTMILSSGSTSYHYQRQ